MRGADTPMAKKRKETTEEEEFDIKLPKFDEEKFLKRERRNIKTLFIAVILGLIIAVISFGFWVLLTGTSYQWTLVLLLGIFNASWLRYIFIKLSVDMTDFGKGKWATTLLVYFFTWLLALILLTNPPFYDAEAPQIDAVMLPGMQEIGGSVLFAARITDNVAVVKQGINFSITTPLGQTMYPDFAFENNTFTYTFENPENLMGEYAASLVVSDVNHHANQAFKNMSFTYSNATMEITSSRFFDLRSGDAISINANEKIGAANFRVYYIIDNGSQINVDRKDPANSDKYETSAEFHGWTENTNCTVTVYAEASYYFINSLHKFNNTVRDTTLYHFSTGTDNMIGASPNLVEYNYTLAALRKAQLPNTLNYPLPYPRGIGNVPGFELIVFVLALLAVVVIVRRKKKNKAS
jgi:hypothetical protein